MPVNSPGHHLLHALLVLAVPALQAEVVTVLQNTAALRVVAGHQAGVDKAAALVPVAALSLHVALYLSLYLWLPGRALQLASGQPVISHYR